MKTFKDFLSKIPKLRNSPLPGFKAQQEMAAVKRLDEMQRTAMKAKTAKEASVMMLIYERDNSPYFVLIERVKSAGKHSGQIAFPGGRKENSDTSNGHTALRETFEEIGIPMEDQHLITAGTPLYIPPSNYMVYPFLAFAKANLTFIPQTSEVNGIIEIPLESLFDHKNATQIQLSTSYMTNVTVPCYDFNGVIVWGATAMMLAEFKSLLLS